MYYCTAYFFCLLFHCIIFSNLNIILHIILSITYDLGRYVETETKKRQTKNEKGGGQIIGNCVRDTEIRFAQLSCTNRILKIPNFEAT